MQVKVDLVAFFVNDHTLHERGEKVLVHESLVEHGDLVWHPVSYVTLAFVHRILDDLRPFVIPVKALVEKARLLPFGLRLRGLIIVDGDPEIVVSIARATAALFARTRLVHMVEKFVQRLLQVDDGRFLDTQQR